MAMWSKRTLQVIKTAQMGAIFTAPLKTFGFLVYQRRTACREIEPRVNRAISKIPR